jgi:hypothetical protein
MVKSSSRTTTSQDAAPLRERGVTTLVTTTPEFDGRSFGTNVMEGVLIALAGKRPEEMQPGDCLGLLRRLGWKPRVLHLAADAPLVERGQARERAR